MSTPDHSNLVDNPFMVILHHNLDPDAFLWLWGKYVVAPDLTKHCTACLKSLSIARSDGKSSPYSQRFSKASNPLMRTDTRLVMDENGSRSYAGLYLCGVSAAGYSAKKNYPHNFHASVVPSPGHEDTYRFEDWVVSVENGHFTKIPVRGDLPSRFLSLPVPYVTCRIFRWAACILPTLVDGTYKRAHSGLHS